MKIGLLQVQGIGDILIAIPIARWFMRQGHEIFWPINRKFLDFYSLAAPDIGFIGIDKTTCANHIDYFYNRPLLMAHEAGCDRVFVLFNYLEHFDHPGGKLTEFLNLDAYKYAVTGCPFTEKWTLQLQRDMGREKSLFYRLGITREYIVVHSRNLENRIDPTLPPDWAEKYQIVRITELTDNPFDWIYTLEHASKLVLLESMYSNLVEQLNLPNEKYLLIHSPPAWTPVYKNGWLYSVALEPITECLPLME
jgi:hypothetical protein